MIDRGAKYKMTIESLERFYSEVDILEPTGSSSEHLNFKSEYNEDFIGIPFKSLEENKYRYTGDLSKLEQLPNEIEFGGSKMKTTWNEFDGDEMSVERFNDGFPYLSKRRKTIGNRFGKFVNLHINISEPWMVSSNMMLKKAYFTIKMTNLIENMGLNVAVYVYMNSIAPAYLHSDLIRFLLIEICVKKHEDPLNKNLIFTTVSPWMLRYYFLRFIAAKFEPANGYGRPSPLIMSSTNSDLYIDSGECLTPAACNEKFKEFIVLFENTDD